MAQFTIHIAGRSFDLVCQDGQEPHLEAAAAILDQEAQKIDAGDQRITENQMLLMAGLLLANRVTEEQHMKERDSEKMPSAPLFDTMQGQSNDQLEALEMQLKGSNQRIAQLETEIEQADACIIYMLEQLEQRLAT